MAFLSTALFSLLLVTDTIAAPAKIQKRGIRAAAHRHIPRHAQISRGTGAVQATNDGGGWIMPVLIGGQQVTLNIDTGTSDLWTASTLMPSDQQSTITTGEIYDPTKSSTYQPMDGYSFSLSYADGSGASGPAAMDTVNIGGATVINMPFGVCSDLRYGSGSSGTRDTDGPVGFGFGAENSIRPNRQRTFMECLEPNIPEPTFSFSLKLNNSGFVDLGFTDTSAYTGDVTTIPIANTSSGNEGQWVNRGVQFGSCGNVFSSAPIDMDFDVGSARLELPWNAAADYFALIPGSSNSSGSWQYPCGTTLPDFDFVFTQVTSGPSTFTIPGSSLKSSDANSGSCSTWIHVVDGRADAGLPFYISSYMMFDQATPSLAFATQTN